MTRTSDFDQLLNLLRGGAVPPDELARLARAWQPDRDPPFFDFVAGPVTASVGTAEFHPADPGDATATYATPDPAGLPTPHATPAGEPSTPGGTTAEFKPGQPTFPLPPAPPGGRYVPLRLYASGGLGSVWVTRDTVVGRDVALKTIRPDRRVGSAEEAGFVREAQLTGRLEHPCVVPVYDLPPTRPGAGPCYVMRFVAGRTLAQATAAYHTARAAGPADPLALAALLDAVVTVARAVGFAHGRGVLHRDLKGQNVVLGDHGEVFLLDWGLAIEESDAAAGGGLSSGWDALPAFARPTPRSFAGTPGFMAPEVVAGGAVSRAADVYGLGGVLYQVLTGRPPYTGTSNDDILRQVKETDPLPVRGSNPAAPPALAAVCHKALARDPAGRYGSADEFATDLRRFLADEPVSAYREPWAARAGRWARRHRTGVVAAAAVLLVTAVGSAAAAALVWREKENTAAQWHRAEGEWKRAERNFAAAEGLAFELGQRVGTIETGVENQRAADDQRLAALDSARRTFDRLRADAPDDPTRTRQAALLHRYAANLRRLTGTTDGADEAYRASIALWEELDRRDAAEPADRDGLVLALRDYATYLKRVGRLTDAVKVAARAAELAAGLAGRLAPSAVARTTGLIELDRADLEYRLGRFAEAEAAAARAAELLDKLAGVPAEEAGPVDGVLAAAARHLRATALRELDRLPAARAEHDAAVARADAAGGAKGGPDARHSANKTRLGRAVTAARDPAGRDAAAKELDAVITAEEALAKELPRRVAYQELTAEAYLLRGELAAAAGRREAAAADLKRALELTRPLVDTDPPLPDHIALRGRVYLALARTAATPAEAAEQYGRAGRVLGLAGQRDPENALTRRAIDAARR